MIFTRIFICLFSYMYTHLNIYVHIYLNIHVYINIYIYVMFVYTYLIFLLFMRGTLLAFIIYCHSVLAGPKVLIMSWWMHSLGSASGWP